MLLLHIVYVCDVGGCEGKHRREMMVDDVMLVHEAARSVMGLVMGVAIALRYSCVCVRALSRVKCALKCVCFFSL